ncbi:MAG: twin-arginine translocation signal domain-containing protein [Burkholderiaceae bacterium]
MASNRRTLLQHTGAAALVAGSGVLSTRLFAQQDYSGAKLD